MDFASWYAGAFDLKSINDPKSAIITDASNKPLEWDEIRAFTSKIIAVNDLENYLPQILADTAYQGFDPRAMASVLRAISKEAKDYEADADPFYLDMAFLIILFLQRGTSVIDPKKMGTMSKTAKVKVAYLKKKYAIKSRVGDANKCEAITLSRIAACFPLATCKIMKEGEISRPVSHETMTAIYPGYPKFLRNSCFFTVFYEGGRDAGVLKALLHYQYLEGRVINQKKPDQREKSKEDAIEDVIKYAAASFRSDLVPLRVRKEWNLNYFGAITETKRDEWEQKFNETFPSAVANVKLYFNQA